MSPGYWNLLKLFMQSYTAEWRRDKNNPDWIILVGNWQWRDSAASTNRIHIVDALLAEK